MDSRLRALGMIAARRRDELAAITMVAVGQAMVWTATPGGDTLLHGSRPWNAVVLAATGATLAWRRRAPLGALIAAVAAFCLSHLVAPHGIPFLPGFAPLLVLTASAGWHLRDRRGVVALLVALAGAAAAEVAEPSLRHPEHLADVLWFVVPWGLLRAVRARDEHLQRLATELAGQEAQRREVVAAERSRIARDLHDIVAHATSVMVIQVGAARMRHAAGESDITGELVAAETTGRQAIDELRRLLDVLREWPEDTAGASISDTAHRHPQPPQPSLTELGALADSYRSAGLDTTVESSAPAYVPMGVQVSAYRIVQEALTNSLRHGSGRPVDVTVGLEGDDLVVDVTDRRPAVPVQATRPGPEMVSGHGLIGMSERARLLGGEVTAGPNRSGGWTVHARLPATERSARQAAT